VTGIAAMFLVFWVLPKGLCAANYGLKPVEEKALIPRNEPQI
jgi:hypothetical protein